MTLVTFTRNAQEEAHAAALRTICAEVYTVPLKRSRVIDVAAAARSMFSGKPFIIERDGSAAMHTLLGHLVVTAAATGQPFDLVHADQLNMAQFAESLPLPRLLDQHNAVWMIFERLAQSSSGIKRWFWQREAALLKRYEGRVCSEFEAVTVVSDEDRRGLLQVMPQERDLPVIPIAVDCEAEQAIPRAPGARAILSLATMMWPPNVDAVSWFARQIYPLVRRAVPDTHFYVCGPRPTAEIRALPELDPTIEVTGYVDDPKPYIANSACLIVPLRSGGGMRVKILEALARGIPVVSTTIGYEGIDLVPGKHLLVADTPSEFADAVALLLREPELGAKIAAAGRKRVLEKYDWRAIIPAMEAVYARITTRNRRTNPAGQPAIIRG